MIKAKSGAIQMARASKGWTQQELAESSGMHRATVRLTENGSRGTHSVSAKKISDALGCKVEELFEFVDK